MRAYAYIFLCVHSHDVTGNREKVAFNNGRRRDGMSGGGWEAKRIRIRT